MACPGTIQPTNPKTSHPIYLFISVLLLAKEFRQLVLKSLLLYMKTFIPTTAKMEYLKRKIPPRLSLLFSQCCYYSTLAHAALSVLVREEILRELESDCTV